jgi:hypothetical protein
MFKYMYENVENSMGETVVLMTFSANALHFIYFILSPLTDRDNSIALLARLWRNLGSIPGEWNKLFSSF